VPEGKRNTKSAIEDPEGNGPRLFFQKVPEDKVAKNRVHLDVRVAPGLQGDERMAALETECGRLVALGAKRLRRFEPEPPLSGGFIVMTDPEGNEFCLD
jgi:Glyoxalase-like domain